MLFPSASAVPWGYSNSKDGHGRSGQGNTGSVPREAGSAAPATGLCVPSTSRNLALRTSTNWEEEKGPYRRLPYPPPGFRRQAPTVVGLGMVGEGLAAAGCAPPEPPWEGDAGAFRDAMGT
jgi:hypothetical protein